jgi:hypothetical protein
LLEDEWREGRHEWLIEVLDTLRDFKAVVGSDPTKYSVNVVLDRLLGEIQVRCNFCSSVLRRSSGLVLIAGVSAAHPISGCVSLNFLSVQLS